MHSPHAASEQCLLQGGVPYSGWRCPGPGPGYAGDTLPKTAAPAPAPPAPAPAPAPAYRTPGGVIKGLDLNKQVYCSICSGNVVFLPEKTAFSLILIRLPSANSNKPNIVPLLHSVHCTLHNAQCTLHNANCTLHIAHCTLHTAHCTLHIAHCTLHTAHCTLHVQRRMH